VLLNSYRLSTTVQDRLPVLDMLALFIAALCHDIEHSGVSNAHLVKHKDPIAIRYENKSPLEQHSFAVAKELLDTDEFAILAHLPQTDQQTVLDIVHDLIIATDITDKTNTSQTDKLWQTHHALFQSQNPPAVARRTVLCGILLCADIGIVGEPLPIYMYGVRQLYREHCKIKPVGVTAYYEGQSKFLASYAKQWLVSLTATNNSQAESTLIQMQENQRIWNALGIEDVRALMSDAWTCLSDINANGTVNAEVIQLYHLKRQRRHSVYADAKLVSAATASLPLTSPSKPPTHLFTPLDSVNEVSTRHNTTQADAKAAAAIVIDDAVSAAVISGEASAAAVAALASATAAAKHSSPNTETKAGAAASTAAATTTSTPLTAIDHISIPIGGRQRAVSLDVTLALSEKSNSCPNSPKYGVGSPIRQVDF
jgi:3'5'-cyclic nucleotide phosphodiesterase